MTFDIKLPNQVSDIINRLDEYGYVAYVVGGCLRDGILGKTPHDWDICTSATPDKVIEIFSDTEVIPTGLQHGTVTIILDHTPYEVTTFRIDGNYSDNRRPDDVKFTTNIIDDLSRRDFTINAMAYNPKTGLIDPFGGRKDIQDGIVRCVGDAKERFGEDALRMLRAIRFAVQLNFNIDYKTKSAIQMLRKNILNISQERITSELNKMVICIGFYMQLLFHRELFALIIPELDKCIDFNQNNPYHCYTVYTHIAHAVGYGMPDLIAKLALLFHDIGKPECQVFDENGVAHYYGHAKISADIADKRMKAMRYDNDTRNKVVELISYHDAALEATPKHIKKWLNKIGEEQFRRLLNVRSADVCAQSSQYLVNRLDKIEQVRKCLEEVLSSEQCFQLKDLAVNGKDLMAIGIEPGKRMGDILDQLLDMVIDGEVENEKDKLLKCVKSLKEE